MTDAWLEALKARHLADLRVPEVTRALRALSSAYVERRHTIGRGAPLDSAGKRAAFAVFYGPLHFLAVAHVVRELGAHSPAPSALLDLGCGTGAAGAAWATTAGGTPFITGIDRNPWALNEARWTYQQFGLRATVRRGDLTHLPVAREGTAILASYVLNELPDLARLTLEKAILTDAANGRQILILEPIARSMTPWWDETVRRLEPLGGTAREWRVPIELPPLLEKFDRAAGLNHRELKLRSLYCPARLR